MARYIKVNPLVAKYLQLESDRNSVKDGNYLLWQSDLLKFGPLTQINEILLQIGGIALMPHEAREEQDGTVTRPLPRATDSRFIMPAKEVETEVTDDNIDGAMSEGDNSVDNPSSDTTDENTDEGSEEDAPTEDEPEPSGEASEETADKNEGDMAEADSGQQENLQNENTEE